MIVITDYNKKQKIGKAKTTAIEKSYSLTRSLVIPQSRKSDCIKLLYGNSAVGEHNFDLHFSKSNTPLIRC